MKINSYQSNVAQQPNFCAYFNGRSYDHVKKLVDNMPFVGFNSEANAKNLIDKFLKNLPNHELEILNVETVLNLKNSRGSIPTGEHVEHVRFDRDYDPSGHKFVRTWIEKDPNEHTRANVLVNSGLDKKIKYTFYNHTVERQFDVLLDEKDNNLKALYELFDKNTLLYFRKPDYLESSTIRAKQKRIDLIKKLTDKLTSKPE